MPTVIHWFRRDLRLADNPALSAALAMRLAVVPLYILDDDPQIRPLGSASRWWLHHSLKSLDAITPRPRLAACPQAEQQPNPRLANIRPPGPRASYHIHAYHRR